MRERSGQRFFTVQAVVIDALIAVTVTAIALTAVVALVMPVPEYVVTAALGGLTIISVGSLAARFLTRPDHIQAEQSHRILEIANRSLAHMRRGLDADTAQAVCDIALREMEAAAVAITDTTRVLGFAGLGQEHHLPGRPIITRATREALESVEHRILVSKQEIGCPLERCLLKAAIVVPLVVRGVPAGTLKFYYTTPRLLNETQVTTAQGLATLLSTQLELSELDRQTALATRMELQALQAQIHPHFLFNTINTIASLIRTDPTEARVLLREFASFYRRTLESSGPLVTLERELEFTRSYLRFEHARFGPRLQVIESVESAALDAVVPSFLLQPVVENCVQHALPTGRRLTITIAATRCENGLRVSVTDDGVGIPAAVLPRVLEPGFGKGLGIALKNVDDRLRGHFGKGSGLSVASVEGEGTEITMDIFSADRAGEAGTPCR